MMVFGPYIRTVLKADTEGLHRLRSVLPTVAPSSMVNDFVPCNALCLGFLYFGFLGLISFTDIDMYRPTRVSRGTALE